ncbi:metallophosphoesterase [Oceanicola sp. 22II-s10i]|nr:metallophosphoesterase [Oceanicola sp. 22II-s10i]
MPDRIALIADIHGNADALQAVLADMAGRGIGAVLNLGDHFSGPLDAAGTWTQLSGAGFHALRGNHDRYLIEQAPEAMWPSDRIAHQALPEAALDWIRALPASLSFDGVYACHATPQDDNTYWSHRATEAGGVTLRDRAEIERFAEGIDAGLILCAHTHLPVALHLGGGRMLVNPGSVGCPGYDDVAPYPHVVETGTPDASYAVLARDGPRWRVTFRQVPYDTARMVAAARDNGREAWARAVGTGWISEL